MAVKMRPPEKADVITIAIGARTYVPGKGGAWTIDDNDADDLRRAGWQDVPSADAAPADTTADAPAPEA